MTPETVTHAPITLPPIAISAGTLGQPATRPEATDEVASNTAPPALILFGRDEGGRAHASFFTAAEEEGATRAATLMGLHTLAVTEAHRPLAVGLPAGRLFAGGKAFVPFCSAKVFTALLAAASLPDWPIPVRAAGKAAEAPSAPGGTSDTGDGSSGAGGDDKPPADDPWVAINLGSVVLAKGDDEDGYYAAKIIATKANQNFVLLWEDYPDLMEFTRHRHDLGLLRPGPASKAK